MSEEFEYKEEWQYPTNIVLNITDDCNLACRYCFVQQKPNYMDLQTAKDSLDWVINNYNIKREKKYFNENDIIHIHFFGGEPMLMFNSIIKPLVEYAKKQNYDKYIQFGITTNGTLLNKESIDFFYYNRFNILLSIDGNKETQDYNRPCKNKQSSFDLVYKNINYLLEKFPYLTFRATVYEPTVNNLFNNYLFAESLGFQSIFFTPDCRHGKWKQENIKIYEQQLNSIFNYRLNEYLLNIKPMHLTQIDALYSLIIREDMYQAVTKIPLNRCGLGTVTISINHKGDLYSCQEQDTRDENNDKIFHLGNIYTGTDINKHKKLLKDFYSVGKLNCENEKLCNNCKINHLCLSYNCPSVIYDLYGNFSTMPEIICLHNQMIYKRCLANMKILVKENNQLFKDYLYTLPQFSNLKQKE